ncbi:PREDICTED: histone-lysine N-methyltransferase ATXR4 [Tarenaya hassleriana]|uniref:histone-lysine N-methyltransferase ATXR4 n=1 Tax=Tarenaya hassleriana TaxID=28532 RepID=UPI00053C238F|nr:PREDICTED: histone-lysine N-methyltransferase ATXR4 [Tarenaya hassleriana]
MMSAFALHRYSRCVSRLKSLHCGINRFGPRLFSTSTAAEDRDGGCPTGPPPIRVGLTESAGRGVFATRRIVAGDLIHTAKPVVAYPSLSSLDSVCYLCLRKLKESAKIQVGDVSFCREDCKVNAKGFYDVEARADWSSFLDYCRMHNVKYPLMVKRLACMIISGGQSADCLDILQPAALSSEMITKMEEGFGMLWNSFRKANFKDEDVAFLTKQWYMGVLARIRINAFRVELVGSSWEDIFSLASASVEGEANVGHAVYLLPSFYNHDCDPNAHILWIENTDARLTALRDVEEGEELRICYIDASMGYEARQRLLSEGFGFCCNCLRCQSRD